MIKKHLDGVMMVASIFCVIVNFIIIRSLVVKMYRYSVMVWKFPDLMKNIIMMCKIFDYCEADESFSSLESQGSLSPFCYVIFDFL